MKKSLLLFSFIIFVISHTSFAQVNVGDSKRWIKMALNTGQVKYNSSQSETDSSYTFKVGGKYSAQELYFKFDKSNNCIYQKRTFECDTCFHNELKSILGKSRYKWKSSAKGEYLSKSSKQLLMTVDESKQLFTITQLYMREKDYQAMYDKATAIPAN
ncbi:hypothetical protein [Mucilaginibacter boryungensis]|uniref:Lipocalin-like domain-containing protein n=1 Tax=Mucilaginibacter boryungensis TaxID=768480 RepID=A0ABR9XN67_9SPHI|nr:hypothetical protein [Mucilaginibacter boryungensis]MBE9668792.1 hypothetical protein [Mucilaginibacter boryungensis]